MCSFCWGDFFVFYFYFYFFAVTLLLASTVYFTFVFLFLFFTLLPWEGAQGGNPGIKRKGRFSFDPRIPALNALLFLLIPGSRPERLPKVTAKEIKDKIKKYKSKICTVLARSLKKNLNAPRPSEHPPVRGNFFLTFTALVAIPKKTTLHGSQSRSWSAEQGAKKKKKSLAAPPSAPRAARSGENKNKKSRDVSTCLGATQVGVTQVSVRLASVQGFLRLVG